MEKKLTFALYSVQSKSQKGGNSREKAVGFDLQ